MRLIDADAMQKYIEEHNDMDEWCVSQYSADWISSFIENAPTVDIKSAVAREIFAEIEKQIARYSHIHRYAEEAMQSTEEYADGTPCEMVSVWEVLSLHKNGWDDYETMNQLEENIQLIAKSYLLKEIEGDIAELKNKYTKEGVE